ncbi:hypothetical protein ABK040_015109 [Willaertia magna]
MRQYPLVCGNVKCKTSQTPLWRKGWTTKEGKTVMLCNACGLHYKKGHYCIYCNQIYKESDADDKEEPWIGCDNCHRWVHQNCERKNGFEIKPNGYLCPCCRNQNVTASTTTCCSSHNLPHNKQQSPTLNQVIVNNNSTESHNSSNTGTDAKQQNKKRRRKPTLDSNTTKDLKKQKKNYRKNNLTIDISSNSNASMNSNSSNSNGNVSFSPVLSNKLSTPLSSSSFTPTQLFPSLPPTINTSRILAPPSISPLDKSSYFGLESLPLPSSCRQSSGSLKPSKSFEDMIYAGDCISPITTTSKLSQSSDEEYAFETNCSCDSESDDEEEYYEDEQELDGDCEEYHFVIHDPLSEENTSVEVSQEEAENIIAKSFGYSTQITRKFQSLSAICSCELMKFTL